MRHRRGPCEHEEVTMEFRLPNLGEGIESATVTAVLVKPGDAVAAGQNVIAVDTDKANIEVPADAAGTVEQILVKPGDKLAIGSPVLRFGSAKGAAPAAPPKSTPPSPKPDGVKNQGADAPRSPKTPQKEEAAAPSAPQKGAATEFKLPALGEGIEGGTITAVLVEPGDAV